MEKNLLWAAKIAAQTKNKDKHFFLGCVALREDGVYVYSLNETVAEEKTPSAHAEARALRKAGKNSILWVARILKNGNLAMAKPCRYCSSLIENKKVTRVYYTIGPNEYGVWIPGNQDQSKNDVI